MEGVLLWLGTFVYLMAGFGVSNIETSSILGLSKITT